jgi:hypothetical protein
MRRCCIRGVPNIARQRKARLGEDFLGGMKEISALHYRKRLGHVEAAAVVPVMHEGNEQASPSGRVFCTFRPTASSAPSSDHQIAALSRSGAVQPARFSTAPSLNLSSPPLISAVPTTGWRLVP